MKENIEKYFLLIHKNYHGYMHNEGWVISLVYYLVNSDGTLTSTYNVHKSFKNNISNHCAIEQAFNHGIICDETGNVIDIDEQKFNDSLYLWQAQELGIL